MKLPFVRPPQSAVVPSDATSGLMPPGAGLRHRLALLKASTRLAVAVALSLATAVLLPAHLPWTVRAVAAWDGFALPLLALIWLTILTLRPSQIRQVARREDPGRVGSLAVVVLGAGVALLAVVLLLEASMQMDPNQRRGAIVVAISAVALSWSLTHTVFTLRYAHLFYSAVAGPPGLAFPGETTDLDYLDFAYFSFTIGMAAQTADVAVRSRALRRLTLLHSVISFAFNAALVALSISALNALL